MQSQKEAPPNMQCKDKFLLQSAIASPRATPKDITPELVNFVALAQPPSPVRGGSEEGSSPRASISENGTVNTSDSTTTTDLIAKLTEEKNFSIQQSKKLQQELELLRYQGHKSGGGVPMIYVILMGLLGILLGYLVK
ncbi:hypothetical protein R6Q57_024986 [Mikania cordata]